MKRFILSAIAMLVLGVSSLFSQDIITKTDGSTIEAKVAEITDAVIKYHRYDNPSGPLYSIPVNSIYSIKYENGTVEKFKIPTAPDTKTVTPKPAPNSIMTRNNSQNISDAQLLRMMSDIPNAEHYRKKARNLRIVAWTGCAVLFGVGVIMANQTDEWGDTDPYFYLYGGGAALLWCTSFNIAAHRQMKKAREAEYYSQSIIESDIMHIGKSRLIAGVNMMGNDMTNDKGIGIGFKINF